ncbi:MAG: tetratricopeptide repeat protein [Alcanivoracaceae bacterium]
MFIVSIALVCLIAAGLLWWLWRREASRYGVRLSLLSLPVIAVLLLTSVLLYINRGLHPDTGRWLADWQEYQEFARQVVAGSPDPVLAEQVPLQSLARVLQRQLHLTPSAEGWYVLALVYSELEAPRVAVTAARRAVEKSDGALEPRLLLARSLIEERQGQLSEESAALLEAIIEEVPRHDGALTLMASAAMQSRDFARALPAWEALLARHGEGEARPLLENMVEGARRQLGAQQHYTDLMVTVEAAADVEPGGTLFVFLRRPGDAGQPLAAVRVLADRFPMAVTVRPENWLQDMPEPGTALVAGARYNPGITRGIEDALESARLVPLQGRAGELSATLVLPGPAVNR